MTRNLCLFLLCLLTLGGCGGGLHSSDPAQRFYVLHAVPPGEKPMPLKGAIAVEVPHIAAGLDTDRIALMHGPQRLDYFAAARWPANLDTVLQDFLIESIDNRLQPMFTGNPENTPSPEYRLISHFYAFQAEYPDDNLTAAPQVRLHGRLALVSADRSKVIMEYGFNNTAKASENSATAITAALQDLLHKNIIGFVDSAVQ